MSTSMEEESSTVMSIDLTNENTDNYGNTDLITDNQNQFSDYSSDATPDTYIHNNHSGVLSNTQIENSNCFALRLFHDFNFFVGIYF